MIESQVNGLGEKFDKDYGEKNSKTLDDLQSSQLHLRDPKTGPVSTFATRIHPILPRPLVNLSSVVVLFTTAGPESLMSLVGELGSPDRSSRAASSAFERSVS